MVEGNNLYGLSYLISFSANLNVAITPHLKLDSVNLYDDCVFIGPFSSSTHLGFSPGHFSCGKDCLFFTRQNVRFTASYKVLLVTVSIIKVYNDFERT